MQERQNPEEPVTAYIDGAACVLKLGPISFKTSIDSARRLGEILRSLTEAEDPSDHRLDKCDDPEGPLVVTRVESEWDTLRKVFQVTLHDGDRFFLFHASEGTAKALAMHFDLISDRAHDQDRDAAKRPSDMVSEYETVLTEAEAAALRLYEEGCKTPQEAAIAQGEIGSRPIDQLIVSARAKQNTLYNPRCQIHRTLRGELAELCFGVFGEDKPRIRLLLTGTELMSLISMMSQFHKTGIEQS